MTLPTMMPTVLSSVGGVVPTVGVGVRVMCAVRDGVRVALGDAPIVNDAVPVRDGVTTAVVEDVGVSVGVLVGRDVGVAVTEGVLDGVCVPDVDGVAVVDADAPLDKVGVPVTEIVVDGVADGVGVLLFDTDGVGVPVDVDVPVLVMEGVGVPLGDALTAVMQDAGCVTVLLCSVTAVCARARPSSVALVRNAMFVCARMIPRKIELAPNDTVAETCQKTSHDWHPLIN